VQSINVAKSIAAAAKQALARQSVKKASMKGSGKMTATIKLYQWQRRLSGSSGNKQ